MRKNVGGYERIARILVGGVLTYLALSRWRGKATGKVAMSVGTTLLSTGLACRCPVNASVGRSSYRTRERREGEGPDAMGDLPA